MNLKIIASDYDGTFNFGGVDDNKLNAVKLWREKGNLFGLVTGRGIHDALRIIEEKALNCDYIIANNGAVILRPDSSILCDVRCEGALAIPLINFLFEIGCPFAAVNSSVNFRINNSTDQLKPDEYTAENFPEILYFYQISTMLDDDIQAADATRKIRDNFGASLNPLQNGRCIDIVHKSVNKAQGIYNLLKIFNADYEDVITVGDNINDADMIKEFYSYAMNNAVASIKDLADCQTTGITQLIEIELSKMS